MVKLRKFSNACAVGHDVAEVAHVPLHGIGRSMRHSSGIIMASRRGAVRRGAIAFLMDMKAVWAGFEAGDLAVDADTVAGAAEVNSPLGNTALSGAQNGDAVGGLFSDRGAASEPG